MAVQTAIGESFRLRINYEDQPPPTSGPIEISISNPDVALVQEDPDHPGDSSYALIMPSKAGGYIVAADDGVFHGTLPELESVAGEAPPLPDQLIILA